MGKYWACTKCKIFEKGILEVATAYREQKEDVGKEGKEGSQIQIDEGTRELIEERRRCKNCEGPQ